MKGIMGTSIKYLNKKEPYQEIPEQSDQQLNRFSSIRIERTERRLRDRFSIF